MPKSILGGFINALPKNATLFKVLLELDAGHLRNKILSSENYKTQLVKKFYTDWNFRNEIFQDWAMRESWQALGFIMQHLNLKVPMEQLEAFANHVSRCNTQFENVKNYVRYIFIPSLESYALPIQENIINIIARRSGDEKYNQYALKTMAEYGNDMTRMILKLSIGGDNQADTTRNILSTIAKHTTDDELCESIMEGMYDDLASHVTSYENNDYKSERHNFRWQLRDAFNYLTSVLVKKLAFEHCERILNQILCILEETVIKSSNHQFGDADHVDICAEAILAWRSISAVLNKDPELLKINNDIIDNIVNKIFPLIRNFYVSSDVTQAMHYAYQDIMKGLYLIVIYRPEFHEQFQALMKDVVLFEFQKDEIIVATAEILLSKPAYTIREDKAKEAYEKLAKKLCKFVYIYPYVVGRDKVKTLGLLLSHLASKRTALFDEHQLTDLFKDIFSHLENVRVTIDRSGLLNYITHTEEGHLVRKIILDTFIFPVPISSPRELTEIANALASSPFYSLTEENNKNIQNKIGSFLSRFSELTPGEREDTIKSIISLLRHLPERIVHEVYVPKLMDFILLQMNLKARLSFSRFLLIEEEFKALFSAVGSLLVNIINTSTTRDVFVYQIAKKIIEAFNNIPPKTGYSEAPATQIACRFFAQFLTWLVPLVSEMDLRATIKNAVFRGASDSHMDQIISLIFIDDTVTRDSLPREWREDFLFETAFIIKDRMKKNDLFVSNESFLKNIVEQMIGSLNEHKSQHAGVSTMFFEFLPQEKPQIKYLEESLKDFNFQRKFNEPNAERNLLMLLNNWIEAQKAGYLSSQTSANFLKIIHDLQCFCEAYLPKLEEEQHNKISDLRHP